MFFMEKLGYINMGCRGYTMPWLPKIENAVSLFTCPSTTRGVTLIKAAKSLKTGLYKYYKRRKQDDILLSNPKYYVVIGLLCIARWHQNGQVLCSISLNSIPNVEKFHVKYKSAIGGNDSRDTSISIGVIGIASQLCPFTNTHRHNATVPSLNHVH